MRHSEVRDRESVLQRPRELDAILARVSMAEAFSCDCCANACSSRYSGCQCCCCHLTCVCCPPCCGCPDRCCCREEVIYMDGDLKPMSTVACFQGGAIKAIEMDRT